jgi:hypothetical protein
MEEQLNVDMEAQLHNEDITNAAPINTIEGSDAWSVWRESLVCLEGKLSNMDME